MRKRNVAVLLSLTTFVIACQSTLRPKQVQEEDLATLQHPIAPQPVPIRGKLEFDRGRLPDGATGKFSSYDGDNFLVNIPPKVGGPLSSDDVFTQVVAPLMQGMGYGARVGDMVFPRGSDGVQQPRSNLSQLAAQTCREVASERYQRFHPVCEAMVKGEADPTAERVFRLAYGMSFSQFKADIERLRIQYVYRQLGDRRVPIEHAAVIATRFDGETVTSVHGVLFNRYRVTNEVKLSPNAAIDAGLQRLIDLGKFRPIYEQKRPEPAELVLLPYGAARDASGDEVVGLRYAYRTLLMANPPRGPQGPGHYLSWLAWIDADSGELLELSPQFWQVTAQGRAWTRDPNTPAQGFWFEVDAAVSNQYTLRLANVFNRFDRMGDGAMDDAEVSIPDNTNGSTSSFANFNQAPLNDNANALCSNSSNLSYRQINAYAHLYSFRAMIVNAGTFPSFPEQALTVWMDTVDGLGNNAAYDAFGTGQSRLTLVPGSTFAAATCPDAAGGVLPGATDPTSMTHELQHLSAARLTDRRPANWCGMPPCTLPLSTTHYLLHDFADAWAHAYASTPCQAGWSRKNSGGIDAAENCATHDESGGLPRLANVGEPFSTASIQDHFPEKRPVTPTASQGYLDSQIMVTGLWLTRQGMRSKCLPSGTPQYFIRINRALYNFGFMTQTCSTCPTFANVCSACDRDIYRFGQDMLRQLTQQWATAGQPGGPPGFAHNGAHTTNKLLSAWARVGMFLIPFGCIDGDAATTDPTFCPSGEMGGDAIVDVRDNDPGDDVTIDQILHPEFDYAQRGDPPPTFRVWTGPRYKFDASGVARSYTPSAMTPAPCHTQYQVELASNDTFSSGLVTSGWQNVSATAQPECYGTWQPMAADWTTLSGTTGDVRVYYRVRTRDASMMNEKISTSPGSGSYLVPPAYVVVNNAGQP